MNALAFVGITTSACVVAEAAGVRISWGPQGRVLYAPAIHGRLASESPLDAAQAERIQRWIADLEDEEWYVRCEAAESLGALGPRATEAVPALISALTRGDDFLRADAANALGRVGRGAAAATPALTGALGDEYINVRTGAARALEAIRPRKAEAQPTPVVLPQARELSRHR